MTIDSVFAHDFPEAERFGGKHVLVISAGSGGSALYLMLARAFRLDGSSFLTKGGDES